MSKISLTNILKKTFKKQPPKKKTKKVIKKVAFTTYPDKLGLPSLLKREGKYLNRLFLKKGN